MCIRDRHHADLSPNKPDGLKIKTIAISIYIDIEAIDEPIKFASALSKNNLNNSGSKKRPNVSVTPTNKAPTKAPLIEPIPPMIITTNANIRTGSPIPTSTDCIAPINAPDKPATQLLAQKQLYKEF